MIPVGGYYTIDAGEAQAVVDAVRPRVVIPMHYRQGSVGFPELGELSEFTARVPDVRREAGPLTLTREIPEGVVILTPEV